jgi:hypothetical protein
VVAMIRIMSTLADVACQWHPQGYNKARLSAFIRGYLALLLTAA